MLDLDTTAWPLLSGLFVLFHIPVWLFLSGLPSLLYAISNHIDKHLLEEHFKGDLGVTALLLISALVSAVAIIPLWVLSPDSLIPDNWLHLGVYATVGLLHTALLWFYFIALSEEDTVNIVVFYSVLPVLGLVTANLFLGETLLTMQLIAMAIIVVGVLTVSFEGDGSGGYRLKLKAAGLMFLASLCWALGDVTFKYVALEESVWQALFWEHVILTVVGIVMLVFATKTRKELRRVLRLNSAKIISINLTSEVIYIIANAVGAFPLVMVQVAAVHLVQSFQPVWVFLIAIMVILIHKFRGRESKGFALGEFLRKLLATVIAVSGMWLLAVSTPA